MSLLRLSLCLPLLAAIASPVQPAFADPPATCSVTKSGKAMSCPKAFEIITDSDDGTPGTIHVNDPITTMHECIPRRNGMTCEGWPQEYGSVGNLTYQWSIRVGGMLTNYPVSTNPVRSINCTPMQGVETKLTVTNGTYSATSTNSYGCGNEIQ